tara:strand:- start:1237 stop:2337 length:1101 start_codon:yes stop_codon:yes gene_type:complete
MKGRLIYLATINLKSNKAQSIQVLQVVKSLNRFCKTRKIIFNAFSYYRVPDSYDSLFNVFGKRYQSNRFILNLKMIYFLIISGNLRKSDMYYSRDLLTLLILSLLGFKSLYEFHHPAPFLNTLIFSIYTKLPNTKLITISNALKSSVIKNLKINPEKIKVLHSCVDLNKYDDIKNKSYIRNKLGFDNSKYYVLHTGSSYKGRGVEAFIELCKVSSDIFFIHIGGTEKELLSLKILAKEKGIKNFKLIPTLPQINIIEYQIAADLLFYIITEKWPTYWCCSPMKIPEYMASNTPILASSIGSVCEILDDKNAFLYNLGGNNMIKSFKEAKSNPELAKKKALYARKKVESKYTWDIRAKSLLDFIENN